MTIGSTSCTISGAVFSAAPSHPSPVFQPTSVGAVDLNDVTWSKFMAFRADYFSVGGMLAALRGDIWTRARWLVDAYD